MIVSKLIINQFLGVAKVAGRSKEEQFTAMAKVRASKTGPLKGKQAIELTAKILPSGDVEVTCLV